MTVIRLDDYRRTPESKPVEIWFLGFQYRLPDRQYREIDVVWPVSDGDYLAVIKGVQERGGIDHEFDVEPFGHWFLPWPCKTIRIVES